MAENVTFCPNRLRELDKPHYGSSSQSLLSVYEDTREYGILVARTVTNAILAKAVARYVGTVVIDGLNSAERQRISREMRRAGIRFRRITGIRDEASPYIRLTDALAGFTRDHEEKSAYTNSIYERLVSRLILTRLQ